MKIHDLLVWSLTQHSGKEIPLVRILGTSAYKFKLEESLMFRSEDAGAQPQPGTPDIIIEFGDKVFEINGFYMPGKEKPDIVIEIEGDVDFDFAESIRQVKKYKRRFTDVRIIIPKECQKFAILYQNEGIPVYLWRAIRIWECEVCGMRTNSEKHIIPRHVTVKNCKGDPKYQKLIDIKDVIFEEAT